MNWRYLKRNGEGGGAEEKIEETKKKRREIARVKSGAWSIIAASSSKGFTELFGFFFYCFWFIWGWFL